LLREKDLPDQVLGVIAKGEVTAEDYRGVLIPEVESKLAKHKKLRLLYVLGEEFTGFTGGAAWEDASVGMRHFTSFERIAVVSDLDWVRRMVKALGFVVPGGGSVSTIVPKPRAPDRGCASRLRADN
jgi:hypothetical protein